MDESKDQETGRTMEGAEGGENNTNNTQNGDKTSEQGTVPVEQNKPKIVDMSAYIVDNEENVKGLKQYRISLNCKDERVRLAPGEQPEATIDKDNILTVMVGDKLYHQTELFSDVKEGFKPKPERTRDGKKIIVLLDKKKHELWT